MQNNSKEFKSYFSFNLKKENKKKKFQHTCKTPIKNQQTPSQEDQEIDLYHLARF